MGNFNIEDLDDDVIDALILKGGREKATISRENNILKSFTNFVKNELRLEIQMEDLWNNKEELEDAIIKFFVCLRVKKYEYPKRKTVESYKSFLKQLALKNSTQKFDISNAHDFSRFTAFYSG